MSIAAFEHRRGIRRITLGLSALALVGIASTSYASPQARSGDRDAAAEAKAPLPPWQSLDVAHCEMIARMADGDRRLMYEVERGNYHCLFLIGLLQLGGYGFAGNGLDNIRAAAESGSPDAQGFVGFTYLYGTRGVRSDRAAALIWLERAAKNGNLDAKDKLAEIKTAMKESAPRAAPKR